ncbi:MAG: hypothetical protein FJX42_05785 [Alphaproteobacteria bacterium]|nr:hypothetical protein [Alphaproteobacteria bacterium]
MTEGLVYVIGVTAALLPLGAAGLRREGGKDALYLAGLASAVVVPAGFAFARMSGIWRTDLSTAIEFTVAAGMVVFAIAAVSTRHAFRLAPLLVPYMALLATLAALWRHAPRTLESAATASTWVVLHIATAVVTYGLVTVAAVASFAALLQERALKAKRPTTMTRLLPSIADCENLVVRLLLTAEVILAAGIVTGMGALYRERGSLLSLDHKTILTVAAFGVLAALLVGHFRLGLRGRQAARFVLVGYLLLTLGYPGVKFVTEVLLGR